MGGMRRAATAVVVDAALIVLFAAMGRRAHEEGSAIGGTLTVAAPFLIGYAVGAVALRLDRAPFQVRRGAMVWGAGVVLGLVLRGAVFGRGLAPAFVVVAIVTTGVLLVGWRSVLARLAAQRRRAPG